ncbi:Ig-like domain-containing protein [Metabacillus sp. FJAT-52054]|uniref:Ig-like domain-containing protein n=1 Tax=Metabacillus sediminis TaxID=3117746 RepID=A0ABZ2NHD3_9BACI
MFKFIKSKWLLLPLSALLLIPGNSQAASYIMSDEYKPLFAAEGSSPVLHPNGKLLVTDHVLYNIETGQMVKKLAERTDKYFLDYFTDNGKYLISSGDQTIVRDGSNGEPLFELPIVWGDFSSVSFNESIVASVSGDADDIYSKHILTITDLETKEVLLSEDYGKSVENMEVSLHPSKPLVAITYNKDVEIINYDTGKSLYKVTNPFDAKNNFHAIWDIAYSPDGKRLVLISSEKHENMILLDAENEYSILPTDASRYKNVLLAGNDTRWLEVGFTPDSKQVYTVGYDGIQFYHAMSGKLENTIKSSDAGRAMFMSFSKTNKIARETVLNNSGYAYVEVYDYPLQKRTGESLRFEDPILIMKEARSTYYGMKWISPSGSEEQIMPGDVKLRVGDSNIIEVDENNKLWAKKSGSTILYAEYKGFSAKMNVHVKPQDHNRIAVDPLYDSNYYVTGTYEPNQEIFVHYDKVQYRTVSNSAGAFSLYLDKPLTANSRVWVSASDEEDEEYVLRDTVAPEAPIIKPVTDSAPIVEGETERFATVKIHTGTEMKTIQADQNGKFQARLTALKGGQLLYAKAIDRAGNMSKEKTVKISDTKAPAQPVLAPVTTESTAVTGKVEKDSTVYIKINEKTYKTTAKNGVFSLAIQKQMASTPISVYCMDAAGHKSSSVSTKVTDKTPPPAPVLKQLNTASVKVAGNAETGTINYIAINGRTYKAQSINGSFSLAIQKQKKGTSISVYSVDPSGNKSKTVSIKVAG